LNQQPPVSPQHRRQVDDLIERIRLSADKLAADKPARGDLKILSRTLRELRYAFKVFAPYRSRRKVTVFGSARTESEAPTYQQAVRFGAAMAERDWMVVTGAAAGIMEAGHVGAGREHSMGLNIMLPFEQEANPVIAGDHKLVNMKYFFTRKLMFVKECNAVVCLPGGFGTLDEALEVLTLLQTGKRDMVPVILLDAPGGTYWKQLRQFFDDQLLAGNMISPMDSHLFLVTDDYQQAVDEVLNFFTVFHSMRYVHDRLVFRLEEAISPELLAGINEHFKDLLTEGDIELSEALPEEKSETDLKDLTRLVFHFDRRSHGRLRQMINCLNQRVIPDDVKQ